MANDIGFSYAPGSNSRLDMQQGQQGARGISPQQAVKILSLRVPERPSPTAIAPMALLQSQGGMAPGAGGLQSMIAALIQAFKPQMDSGNGGFSGGTFQPGDVSSERPPVPGFPRAPRVIPSEAGETAPDRGRIDEPPPAPAPPAFGGGGLFENSAPWQQVDNQSLF